MDFTQGQDHLEISAAAFGGGLVAGALSAAQFTSSPDSFATTTDQRFIYNNSNSLLYFDGDGSGGNQSAVLIGYLNFVAINNFDFVIV